MTHLNIQQGSDVEIVSAQIIKKLYDIALTVSEPLEGETDAAYMSGHISVPYTYESYVNYLAGTIREGTNGIVSTQRSNPSGRFLNLTIDVTNGYYIPFEDPKMVTYLNSIGVGSNGAVTTNDAAAATVVANSVNTEITKFNELKYFTSITESRGGWDSNGYNYVRFCGWTALEEVNISNFTSIGHAGGVGWEDSFKNCTSLKKVTASDKLTKIGFSAFEGCSNLEDIVDENGNPALSGTITISSNCFHNCKKLKDSNFTNCSFIFNSTDSYNCFLGCLVTSIPLATEEDQNNPGTRVGVITTIPDSSFNDCTNLTTVTGLDNVINWGNNCFFRCTSLAIPISTLNKSLTIGAAAFCRSSIAGELYMKNLTSLGGTAFSTCRFITKVLCLGNINTIEGNVFYLDGSTNSSVLAEVYLPYECTKIKAGAFQNCVRLTTLKQYEYSVNNWVEGLTPTFVDINRVTSFGNSCFNGCINLTETIDLTNVTEIGLNAFRNTKILVTGTPSANINISPGAFYLCSNLTSFDFSNITTLNDSVFYESGLSGTLSIPNLTGVLRGAEFYKCTGLTSITNLGNITSICDNPYTSGGIVMGSFTHCTGLTSITIPSTVTKIGYNAFAGCTSLSQVNCSWLNIIEIGHSAFMSHADWDFVVNLLNLTTLGRDAFGGYRSVLKKIRLIYLPKITQTDKTAYYNNYMYYSGTFTALNVDIIYLRDILSLHPGDFAYTTCTALVINNIIPPVWKNSDDLTDEETTNSSNTKDKVFSGSTITNIYVPDSAVTTYQTDANWSSVANKIQPLSNLTKVATEANLLANQVALIEAYM